MTAIKCRQEYRTLIDFSDVEKISKNSVKKLLRKTKVSSYRREEDQIIYTTYEINVGMYKIRLLLDLDLYKTDSARQEIARQYESKLLGTFGLFYIELYEQNNTSYQSVLTDKDKRFKTQYWCPYLQSISVNDLTNIIVYCNRLHNLKAFL